jgi:pimeloyl-ACP methyl ester carboxylesterase
MTRTAFTAPVAGGELAGWVQGDGEPVLLLHGGPGLSHGYMEEVASELDGFQVASYQQRGLPPSSAREPYGIAQEVEDVTSVLDALGWDRAWVVGHSWGGHLALRLVGAIPDRLLGSLAVDPIGIVGDGGKAAFEETLLGRLTPERRAHFDALEAREAESGLTEELQRESFELLWPGYFADPARTPPPPETDLCVETFAAVNPHMAVGVEPVAAAIASGRVPLALLAGERSPIPWREACGAVADLSAHVHLTVVPDAGHFVWFEAPGSVRAALERLRRGA